jgi:hypothetical protein
VLLGFWELFHRPWLQTIPETTETQIEFVQFRGGILQPCQQAVTLRGACTAPNEMHNEKHYTHDEKDVNYTNTYVKCEEPKQPKHNQNQCN